MSNPSSDDLPAGALQQLAPTGALRFGIAVGPTQSAVWTVRDPQTGKPKGVTVDLAGALARALGVPLALVEYSSSGKIIEAADLGEWDVACTPVDAERKERVDFGPSYFLGESTYMVAPGSAIQTIEEVNQPGVRVFGVEGTATIRSSRRTLTQNTAVGVAGLDEALAAMTAGKADALALGKESLRALIDQFPGARILPGHFHAAGTAIAVPHGRPLALAYVTSFIERAKADGTVRSAFDKGGMADADVAPAGWMS